MINIQICIINSRFKLPRNQYYFGSIKTTVGNIIEAGLPNITGDLGHASSNNGINYNEQGALFWQYKNYDYPVNAVNNTAHNYGAQISFDASLSNPIYGNSSTVQPLSIQCYLEFYIN